MVWPIGRSDFMCKHSSHKLVTWQCSQWAELDLSVMSCTYYHAAIYLLLKSYTEYNIKIQYNQTVNDGVAHSKNPRKCAYHISRDLWPWPWAHPGCTLTWSPSCASLVAIRPCVCEKKRFAQKFTDRRTDGQTDDGRLTIALAHSWNELKNRERI